MSELTMLMLLWFLNLVSALSVAAPGRIPNVTTPKLSRPNIASYFEPSHPHGLFVRNGWSTNVVLDAAEVWLCFVVFQSVFAVFDKYEVLTRMARFNALSRNVLLVVNESDPAEPEVHELHYGQIVWCFYDIGVEMAHRYPMPTGVHSLESQIYTPQRLGAIRIYPVPRPNVQLNTNATREGLITARGAADNKALRARRGEIRSMDDPNLVVYYQFDGQALQPDRMLTTFLRSMTFCSEHDEDELNAHMIAFSADRLVRLRMDGVSGAGAHRLSWRMARLALRTLWVQVVMGLIVPTQASDLAPRWESFSFFIDYRDVRIGQGWVG